MDDKEAEFDRLVKGSGGRINRSRPPQHAGLPKHAKKKGVIERIISKIREERLLWKDSSDVKPD